MEKFKNVIKECAKKENYIKSKIIILIIISIIIAMFFTLKGEHLIWDRLPIFFCIIAFIGIHFIFKLEKIYNFIFKRRFVIAFIFLIYVIIMGYSGSSIGIYNEIIQPQNDKYVTPILGQYRGIRSDEWVVSTPVFISQAIDESPYYNDNLRGTKTDMYALLSTPVNDILILGKPFNIGFLLFGAERGLSFFWYGKLVALMLVTFEFMMIITNKKKCLSMCGMLVITFSAAIQWWNAPDMLIFGQLILVLIDKFMLSKHTHIKLLCSLGIFISAVSYVFILYPAWQLSYGYIYFSLFIWIFWKNRKEYKINIKDVVIVLCIILLIIGMGLRYYKMSQEALKIVANTDYPGKRFEIGGDAKGTLFSYVYSIVLPYKEIVNPCEISGMTSFYPIPLVVSLIYLIRNYKNSKQYFPFFIPLLLLSFVFSVWTLTSTNELFAKLTLLYMVPPNRLVIPLGLIQIYLLIFLMSHTSENTKILNKNLSKGIAIITSIYILSVATRTVPEPIIGGVLSYILGLILLIVIYLMFNLNEEKNKKYLIYLLIPISIITGVYVNPIQRGIKVLTDKPLSKEVQKIIKEDVQENNLWIVDNMVFHSINYILANGASVLNSTQIYPNKQLFDTILGEDSNLIENRYIYNRYAHLLIEIVDEPNRIELIYADSIKIYLNYSTVKELGVRYILTNREIDNFNSEEIQFEQMYNEQGFLIYKAIY